MSILAFALWLAAAASAAPVEALLGETSPLKIVLMAPSTAEDRGRALEDVRSARDRCLRAGLLLRVDDEVLEAREASDIPKDGLVLVLASGLKPGDAVRALDGLLGPKSGWKNRFPFATPNPAALAPRDRPTAHAYLATEGDFRLMDRALEGVWKQGPVLFPGAPRPRRDRPGHGRFLHLLYKEKLSIPEGQPSRTVPGLPPASWSASAGKRDVGLRRGAATAVPRS